MIKETYKMSDDKKETSPEETKSELIYKLEDRPPLKEALFAAFQHLLAIFEFRLQFQGFFF